MASLVLNYKKCFFCNKNFNNLQLIDISQNAVTINDEEIEYKDLIFDVCLLQIDTSKSSYICTDCNNNLLSFHFFKRDAKKYTDFWQNLEKLKILAKVEEFLGCTENLSELEVQINEGCSLIISLKTVMQEEILNSNEVFESTECIPETLECQNEVEYDVEMIDEDTQETADFDNEVTESDPESQENVKSSEILVISSQKNAKFEKIEEKSEKESSNRFYLEEVIDEEFLDDEHTTRQIKKRKINTLDDLSESQIAWIRANVTGSEAFEGKSKVFKCAVCQQVLATQSSLIRHLRDVHVLKNENDEKFEVKKEVAKAKLEVKTSQGVEIVFKCQQCEGDRIYRTEQTFKNHLRMTHIRTTKVDTAFIAGCKTKIYEGETSRDAWRCPDCNRIFRHRDSLRNHIKIEHPKMTENVSKKPIQKVPVEDSINLTRIIQKLENKSKSTNFCHECGIRFETAKHHNKPKVHQDSHEILKQLAGHLPRFRCDDCRMIFNTDEALKHHFGLHGSPDPIHLIPADGLSRFGAKTYKDPVGDADDAVDEAVWKCAHCPVRFFEENDCLVHILMMHSASIYCCIDNMEFSGSTGLGKFNQHMKNKHPELFPDLKYPCGACEEEFSTIYDKLAHQKSCKSKKFECDYCEKRFLTKHQLQSHILYELGLAGVSCEVCGKRCKTLSDLKIHQNTHTQSRPYQCTLCPKSFKTPGARSTHMEGHNYEKLECPHCGQKLASRTLYKRHLQFQHNQQFRNTQLSQNICEICQKAFVRSSHFKLHMKQQHGIK